MSATTELRTEAAPPKRQLMLEAGAKLFMSHGYGTVSMDAIARAAGVSKATLYAHFASKDHLFATIIDQGCQEHLAVGALLPGETDEIATALTEMGGRVLRFLLQDEKLAIYRVVVGESWRFPELGRAFYENGPVNFCRAFAGWLTGQQAAGRLSMADPMVAAEQFIALLRAGLYTRATLGLTPPPSDAEIDATVAAAAGTFLKAYAV
jgi:TetR/AcrR family transcriptional repressor of mexJK operon